MAINGDNIVTASCLINLVPKRGSSKTPWELFYDAKTSTSHIRVCGCLAMVHLDCIKIKQMQFPKNACFSGMCLTASHGSFRPGERANSKLLILYMSCGTKISLQPFLNQPSRQN
jgi:hypothetical protein